MKYSLTCAALAAFAVHNVYAAPPQLQKRAACDAPVTLEGNPFTDRKLFANSFYRDEVVAAAEAITDAALKEKALAVAEVGTFKWIDKREVIPIVDGLIKETPCEEIIGLVIYDLPGRDCAAKASNGELPVGALDVYKAEYIDPIREIIAANPNTAIALVIEPDSLPNLVTNIDLQSCQDSAEGYRAGVAYALEQLNFPNVAMYIDAGHGGWLGWDENLTPGAEELASVFKAAGSPSQVRGIATNVSGWNAFSLTPGEFEDDPDGQYNQCQDEQRFVTLFGAALETAGMPNQAIVDTGRNAVQGIREEWGHWCNVDGAGFGVRPTAETGEALVDAFVWVKPGGESDGTSDTTADRFDEFCGYPDAFQPSPEAGQWHQAFFEMLLTNANPPF
ncbi:1,4-beta-D-glucan cellobiohydrolase cel6c [Onygenales sp. PD_40]|nr:1,4-beta-D-glucan cellobiohydrolase cel6c [Onygenales sp. PD_40]KAK2782094.1 1,4-beta-D-glucan cellobiohydrolase cel6c [Emmonsiellopsis sp. PD_33]KAK2783602.1 1,4-beta-D-glucan cellobiohydrolase cel6c [Onygenales sp. PD_12]KAK2794465.1 1,4-beta-D-glucan cellobiohydrolase cel6c [Onygenales sp. PD_10]